jgi:hypothetical protein
MPEHMHRREFIQASAATAGVITAVGLPGAARAASWTTIDAQVHAYERNHPGRPWAAPWSGGRRWRAAKWWLQWIQSGSTVKHPDRFCLVKPVDPNDPAVAHIIADWKAKKSTGGVRVIMRDNLSSSDRP